MNKKLVLLGAVVIMSIFLVGCKNTDQNITGEAKAQLSPSSMANPDLETDADGSWGCYDAFHRAYQQADGTWNKNTISVCRNGLCGAKGECCVNSCRFPEEKMCTGNFIRTCGEYDTERIDPCLEWSDPVLCENGCFNGQCIKAAAAK